MFKAFFSACAVAAMMAPAAFVVSAAEWNTDFEAAKAQAAKEGKAILVDFTGSDWCTWCVRLRQQVLDTQKFQEYAQDKFVLMEVDMPHGKKQPMELVRQNRALCKKFGVSGFPTILALSPQEDVLGGFTGGGMSFEQVAQQLDVAFGNLGKLQAARAAEGVERAKALGEIFKSLPQEFRGITQGYLDEIAACDPGNESQALALSPEEDWENFIAALHNTGNDYAKALELIEAQFAKSEPEYKPDLLRMKANALTFGAKSVEDIVKAREALQEAVGMLGLSREARELRQYIDSVYGDPAAVFNKIQGEKKIAAGLMGDTEEADRLRRYIEEQKK